MTGTTLRWHGGSARLGPWRGRADVGYVAVGADGPPSPEVVLRCIEQLRSRGYLSAVTSALSPFQSLPFVDAGFQVRERLVLLSRSLDLPLPTAERRTRRSRRCDRAEIVALDNLAFDGFWRFDSQGLDDAVAATPQARFRVADDPDGIVGYAITGVAGATGYLQRVAVHPRVRKGGWGSALVADGLRWLAASGAERVLVNTQPDNEAALALYESGGFRRLPLGLCVLGRDL